MKTKTKKPVIIPSDVENVSSEVLLHQWWEANVIGTLENGLAASLKAKYTWWCSHPLLGIYPTELKTCVHPKTYTWIFLGALLREFPSYKQQKCLSLRARMKYFRDIDTEENQSTAKRSKLLIKRWELLGCTKNRFYLCIYVLCMYVYMYMSVYLGCAQGI